jgi:hypothetical protein
VIAVRGGTVTRNDEVEKGNPRILYLLHMTAVIARVRIIDTRNNSSL